MQWMVLVWQAGGIFEAIQNHANFLKKKWGHAEFMSHVDQEIKLWLHALILWNSGCVPILNNIWFSQWLQATQMCWLILLIKFCFTKFHTTLPSKSCIPVHQIFVFPHTKGKGLGMRLETENYWIVKLFYLQPRWPIKYHNLWV